MFFFYSIKTTFSLWLDWPTIGLHFKDPNTKIIFDQFKIKCYSTLRCSLRFAQHSYQYKRQLNLVASRVCDLVA